MKLGRRVTNHFGAQVLHGQSDVVGGDGEEALQFRISMQVTPVGLQEGFQSAVAHVLHDQKAWLCTKRNTQTH